MTFIYIALAFIVGMYIGADLAIDGYFSRDDEDMS